MATAKFKPQSSVVIARNTQRRAAKAAKREAPKTLKVPRGTARAARRIHLQGH